MNHLIAGYGEVGKALHEFFPHAGIADKFSTLHSKPPEDIYDVLHICFPFTDQLEFDTSVRSYQIGYQAQITIIHSSVPIGTADRLDAVSSPIRGVHPYLADGIATFVKYFGGLKAREAANLFAEKGIATKVVSDARTVEAMKLWDTTQYGVMIMLEKEIHEFCRKYGLDFDVVYTQANETYNRGYRFLGMPHVSRPVLQHKEGRIGGHCINQNAALLDSESARRITEAAAGAQGDDQKKDRC